MKPARTFSFFLVMAIGGLLVLFQSCKKKEPQPEPIYLTVSIPGSVMQNELYYPLDFRERSVELDFNAILDSSSVQGNISFSDKFGTLNSVFKIATYGRKIIMAFKMLLAVPGPFIIYYGYEIGMENEMLLLGVKDTRRILRGKFNWDSAEKQKADPKSFLNAVSKIIREKNK